jgi:hypothetical protein
MTFFSVASKSYAGEQAEGAEKAERRRGGEAERRIGSSHSAPSACSASCEPCRCSVHAVQSAAVVLDGELAVPCNPQPALAGLNSPLRSDPVGLLRRNGVEGWVPRVRSLRTRSGPEGSSRKECLLSDAGVPGWSCEPVDKPEGCRSIWGCTALAREKDRRRHAPGLFFASASRRSRPGEACLVLSSMPVFDAPRTPPPRHGDARRHGHLGRASQASPLRTSSRVRTPQLLTVPNGDGEDMNRLIMLPG